MYAHFKVFVTDQLKLFEELQPITLMKEGELSQLTKRSVTQTVNQIVNYILKNCKVVNLHCIVVLQNGEFHVLILLTLYPNTLSLHESPSMKCQTKMSPQTFDFPLSLLIC